MTLAEAFGRVRVSTALLVVGLFGIAGGSVGPWITTILGSAGGLRGDGKVTLISAAVAGAMLCLTSIVGRRLGAIAEAIVGLASLVALAAAGYDLIHIERAAAHVLLFGHHAARAGWGVYLVIGSAGLALAALAQRLPDRVGRGLVATLGVSGALCVAVAGLILESSHPTTASASSVATSAATTSASRASSTISQAASATATSSTTSAARPNAWMVEQGFTSPSAAYCEDGLCGYVMPAGQVCAAGWNQVQNLCERPQTSTSSEPSSGQIPQSLSNVCYRGRGDNYLSAGADVSCGFANNVFYEYWQASGGDPNQSETIAAWSSATRSTYQLSCSPGDGVVECTITSAGNGRVEFTPAAVTDYSTSEAQAYAASGKLGPTG